MIGTAWTVWRQDDIGNRFPVDSFPSQEAAKRLAQELESHGHKQLYWVSRQDQPPESPCEEDPSA